MLLSFGTSRRSGIDLPSLNLARLLASPAAETAISITLSDADGVHVKGPTVTSGEPGGRSLAGILGGSIGCQSSGKTSWPWGLFWKAFTTTDVAALLPRLLILTYAKLGTLGTGV